MEAEPAEVAPSARRAGIGRWLAVLVPFVAGAGLGFLATVFYCILRSFGGDVREREFDAALWLRPDWEESASRETGYHSIRQEMADDLLENYLERGMTSEEVLALIGPQDEDPYFRPDPTAWVYELGPEYGFGWSRQWLVLSFDEAGALSHAERMTDDFDD